MTDQPQNQLPEPQSKKDQPVNVDFSLQDIFGSQNSISGEEELLKVASKFAIQLSENERKIIMLIEYLAMCSQNERTREILLWYTNRVIELKQYVNSDIFVMRALDSIALRKFIGINSFQIRAER